MKRWREDGPEIADHIHTIRLGKGQTGLSFSSGSVRLTCPKGAEMKDPRGLFNTRLNSNTVRAIDLRQDDPVNQAPLKALILEAVRVNKSKVSKR
jgi:hypothetical protein